MNFKIGATVTYTGKKYDNLLRKNNNYVISGHAITTSGILLQFQGYGEFFLSDQFISAPLILNVDHIREHFLNDYESMIQKKEKFSKLKASFPDDKPPDFVDFAKTPFKSNKRKPK